MASYPVYGARFSLFSTALHGLWELSSPARDQSQATATKVRVLTIGLPGNFLIFPPTPGLKFYLSKKIFFYYKMFALQYCAGFCHLSTWISYRHTYVPPHVNVFNSSHLLAPTLSTRLFSVSAAPLLPCRQVHQCHLSRFHTHTLIYNVCVSLSDFTLHNRL